MTYHFIQQYIITITKLYISLYISKSVSSASSTFVHSWDSSYRTTFNLIKRQTANNESAFTKNPIKEKNMFLNI